MAATIYNGLPFNVTAETRARRFYPVAIPSIAEVNSPPSVILGLSFQVTLPGTILGVSFGKSPNDTGTHYADLWKDPNVLLTSGTNAPASETAGGWNTALFPTPIPVTPKVNYYAVRRSPLGFYPEDLNAFTLQQNKTNFIIPVNAGGIRILPGTSGSYYPGSLATGGTDPNNYYLDVIFAPAGGGTVTYSGSQVSGPALSTINGSTLPTATITAPLSGSYIYNIAATDGGITNNSTLTVPVTALYTSTQLYTAICGAGYLGASVTRSATVTSVVSQADADANALAGATAAANAALRCDPVQGFSGFRIVVPNLANLLAGSTSATYSLTLSLAVLNSGTPLAPTSISYLAAPVYNAANLPPNNVITLNSYFTGLSAPTTFYLWPSLSLTVNGITTVTQLPSSAVLLDYGSPIGTVSLATLRFRDVETLSTAYQGYASAAVLTVANPGISAVQLSLNLSNNWDTFSLNTHGNDLVYGLKPGRGYDKLVLSVLQGTPSAPLRQTILNVNAPPYNLNDPYDFANNRLSFTPYFNGAAATASYVLRRARILSGDTLVFDPAETGFRFEASSNFYDYTTPGYSLPGVSIGNLAENDAGSITPGTKVAATFTPFPGITPAIAAFPVPRFTISGFKWRNPLDPYTVVLAITISGTPGNPLSVRNQYAFPLGDPAVYDGPNNLLMTFSEFDTVSKTTFSFTPFTTVFYSAVYNASSNTYLLYANSFPILNNPRTVNGVATYSVSSFTGLPGFPASASGAVTFTGTFAYGETLYNARVNGGVPFVL